MLWIKTHFYKQALTLGVLIISGLWMLSGCGGNDSTGPSNPQVSEISISPHEVTLQEGEKLDFSVFALTASGDTIDTDDIDIEWQWWSTNPDVFDVEQGGLATGIASGEAFCVVEATVSVSQNIDEKLDIRYAGIGFNEPNNGNNEIKSLKLLLEDPEILENSKALLKKKRLRFTGRDSAVVFVF